MFAATLGLNIIFRDLLLDKTYSKSFYEVESILISINIKKQMPIW